MQLFVVLLGKFIFTFYGLRKLNKIKKEIFCAWSKSKNVALGVEKVRYFIKSATKNKFEGRKV